VEFCCPLTYRPLSNGGDLIARARLIQPGLAALIIAGYASVRDADTASKNVAILHKPFRSQGLIKALLHVMGQDSAEKQAPPPPFRLLN
jgi:DNA-binding NtrC family response regulator